MSKDIIYAADLHFGITNRLDDLIWAASAMVQYAAAHDIRTIVVLGDLCHDRRVIGIDVICALYEIIANSKKDHGIDWLAFPGNHDMYLKHSWEINILKPFNDIITVIDEVKLIKINGARFWILPFIQIEKAYMEVLAKIEAQHQDGDVLLTHIGVCGSELNVCFLFQDWSLVSFENSKFDRVYTGHFHIPQQTGRNVWYPGSIIPFKMDEGNTSHGFYVYNTETREHKAIDIWTAGRTYLPDEIVPPPNFLTVPDEVLGDLDLTLIKNNILRISPTQEYTKNERDAIRDELLRTGAREVRFMTSKDDDEVVLKKTDQKVSSQSIFEMVLASDEKTIKKNNLSLKLLRQLNEDITKEGDDRYTSNLVAS